MLFFWQVNIRIWQVNIIIWQVIAEIKPPYNFIENSSYNFSKHNFKKNKKCFRNIYAPHGAKFRRVVWPWPLNTWPENQKGSSTLWGQHLNQVWYWSIEGVKRYWADNSWSTDRPTNRPTGSCKTICPLFQRGHKNSVPVLYRSKLSCFQIQARNTVIINPIEFKKYIDVC